MSLNISENIKLASYTSWLVGGNAQYFCLPKSIVELQEALGFAKRNNLNYCILGGGSNVLISDEGIEGLTICLRQMNETKFQIKDNRIVINCLAGASKSELLKIFLKHQLQPALFLAGLPGDVGGGVVMNAGVAEAFCPREFMELVDSIEVMDQSGNIKTIQKSELSISYRHTDGWQPNVIISAQISWPVNNPEPNVLDRVREANKIRLSKQPLDMPSCGSVFKNPENNKAAQLIDSCGLKGKSIGGAQVSKKHANFIVNTGGASASDIWNLILFVQKTVFEKTNIQLQTEVVRLGSWS